MKLGPTYHIQTPPRSVGVAELCEAHLLRMQQVLEVNRVSD